MNADVIIDKETQSRGHILKDFLVDVEGKNAVDILNSEPVQEAIKNAYGYKLVVYIIEKGSERSKDGVFEVVKKDNKIFYNKRNYESNCNN